MIRATSLVALVTIAAAALAQTVKDGAGAPADRETPAEVRTQTPEIPAGTEPMQRRPDPAAGSPAAKSVPQPAAGNRGSNCRVQRADTDTGFVVVCEEG